MLTTPMNGIPHPELSDSPNAPTQMLNMASAMDSAMLPRFVSTAARDAAITAPVNGQLCFIDPAGSGGQALQMYRDGGWKLVSFSRTILKTADEARTNTIVPAADSVLTFPVEANSTYIVEASINSRTNTISTAQIVFSWSAPAGTTGMHLVQGPFGGATAGLNTFITSAGELFGSQINVGSPVSTSRWAAHDLRAKFITTATAGTVSLLWNQAVASANSTFIGVGSFLKYTKIA